MGPCYNSSAIGRVKTATPSGSGSSQIKSTAMAEPVETQPIRGEHVLRFLFSRLAVPFLAEKNRPPSSVKLLEVSRWRTSLSAEASFEELKFSREHLRDTPPCLTTATELPPGPTPWLRPVVISRKPHATGGRHYLP